MKKIDYSRAHEITVRSQEELDDIPVDFKGRIYIEFGTWDNRAFVRKKYLSSVVARGNSSVEARENSSVEARENSSVVAWENSSVVAWENSSVEAWENSSVEAWGNSSVVARENSSVVARENSSVVAWGNSSVVAWGNSSVVARENSSVVAWGNSSVEARENSSVEAWENSSVEAWGNVQIVKRSSFTKLKISGNSRIVEMPKSTIEFLDFYGIKHTKTKAIMYKAVRKTKTGYVSDYDNSFCYEIGKIKKEICDDNVFDVCSRGIHIAHLNWALDFGKDWENLAILEVESKISDIVLPVESDGKVRTCQIKVLRELPLEECGLYGKIIARRKNQ